jgi:hypothetical protein
MIPSAVYPKNIFFGRRSPAKMRNIFPTSGITDTN